MIRGKYYLNALIYTKILSNPKADKQNEMIRGYLKYEVHREPKTTHSCNLLLKLASRRFGSQIKERHIANMVNDFIKTFP